MTLHINDDIGRLPEVIMSVFDRIERLLTSTLLILLLQALHLVPGLVALIVYASEN